MKKIILSILLISSTQLIAQYNTMTNYNLFDDAITNDQVLKDTLPQSDRKNKIAVLPFRIIIDKIVASEEEAGKGQNNISLLLKDHLGSLELQDVTLTNKTLFKDGITQSNFKGYSPKEFCEMLGVEFVVQVFTETTSKSVSNSSSSSTINGSRKTTFKKSYDSKSQVSIFNDQGATIFNETRKPFFILNEIDSYFASVNYLLKRSPIYKD